MTLLGYFPAATISEFLRRSNYWAQQNRNTYPVKIHRAIRRLYEVIECPCSDDCDCKRFRCIHHLIRREDLSFEECHKQFLECYVDVKAQGAVRNERASGRGYNAVEATRDIKERWQQISDNRSQTHLLCTDWCSPFYAARAEFRPSSDTMYRAKWLSILNFDTFTAYDNGSIALFKRDFRTPETYLQMMTRIRLDIMLHLEKNNKTIEDFRNYDDPSEFFPEILPVSPRPLGNIIDKLYLTL
jgi:hypothetical protein